MEKEILSLDANKASQNLDIPIKIVKENSAIFSDFVCTCFPSSIKKSKFPGNLKLAYITKKENKILKKAIED